MLAELTPKSAAMAGAILPSMKMSNPSMHISRKHDARTMACTEPTLCRSMKLCKSNVGACICCPPGVFSLIRGPLGLADRRGEPFRPAELVPLPCEAAHHTLAVEADSLIREWRELR